MDLKTIIDNAMAAERAEQMKTSPQLTLGELILKLQAAGKPDAPVTLDFGGTPSRLTSWRGRYAELAFDYDEHDLGRPLQQVLADCVAAVGKTFHGYKGGDFVMGRQTPVWVARWGEVGVDDGAYLYPVDVAVIHGKVILVTARDAD